MVGFISIYPVLKTLLAIVLLVKEESADPRPSPTEDGNDKRILNFITWINEMIIVNGPESFSELDQLLLTE